MSNIHFTGTKKIKSLNTTLVFFDKQHIASYDKNM